MPAIASPLRAHIASLHPRLNPRRTLASLERDHAREHHQFSPNHTHGPTAGANDRPPGWKDGSGVVMIDYRAARLRPPRRPDPDTEN